MEVSNQFKSDILRFGKQISIKITIDDTTIEKEGIISCTRAFEGDLFKSFMSYADIELKDFVDIKDKELTVEFGVRADNETSYEYVNWGTFIVDNESIEKSIDKNTTKFTAYDYMLKSCVDYIDLEITYPVTIKAFLNAICGHLGLTLATDNFTNADKLVNEEKFINTGTWTFRDVLDQIAGVAGGIIYVKGSNLYVKYPTDINYMIDEHNLKSLSLFEKWGPVNSLVLSLMPQEDNFYKQNSLSVETDGLTEIKLANNELMNKEREIFIDDLFDRLNGLYFYPFELESFGYGFFDPLDVITIKDLDGADYRCVILNDTTAVTTGLNEKISSSTPETTVTDYSKATSDEKTLYKTILEVDKQNQTINAKIENINAGISNLETSLTIEQGKIEALVKDSTIEINGEETKVKETVENMLLGLDGLTNTLSTTSGNNLIRDSIGCFNDGSWEGDYNLDSTAETRSRNQYGYALLLKNNSLKQQVNVANGVYTLSFVYKKLVNLANVKLLINGDEFILSNNDYTEFKHTFEISDGYITIVFECDTDNACPIINLMLNKGDEKMEWSLNSNETWSDTVKIGRGVRISSIGTDVEFVALADIIGFMNKQGEYITTFDSDGIVTNTAVIKNKATIVNLLIQNINDQTIINRINPNEVEVYENGE